MASPDAGSPSPYRLLHEVATRVHSALDDLPATLEAVARGVVEATCFGVVVVNLARPDGDVEVVAVEGNADARAALLGVVEPGSHWQTLIERGERWGPLCFVAHDAPLPEDFAMAGWVPDVEVADDPDAWDPRDSLFAPLVSSDGVNVGILSVDLPADGRRPSPDQLELLALFADHAALAIEHARMHTALRRSRDELRRMATHDALTGVLNRAGLLEVTDRAAATPGSMLGVVVLDLDGFKGVNDTAGHRAGDAVLVEVAARMLATAGPGDVLARTGGDEFVILRVGDDAGPGPLQDLCRRLSHALACPITTEAGVHSVTASTGWASEATPTAFDRLLSEADLRMYGTKRGRTIR